MRYQDILLERMVKMSDGSIVHGNPSARDVAILLSKTNYGLLRGIAIQTKDDLWTCLVWPAAVMTHNDFYRNAQKSGYDINEDIGFFIGRDVEAIEREALASSLGYQQTGGATIGYYPNSDWAWTTLRTEFPRTFA